MPSAQRIAWAKTRSAVTITVALSILAVMAYLLFGGNPFRRNVTIRALVTDSGGMPVNAPVRLNGIRVGKVEAVELAATPAPGRPVEIRMQIERRAAPHIPEDSTVEIGAVSLLGDKLIDITAGRSARPVQPGAELHYEPPAEIDRAQVIASLERNLRMMDRLLDDIEAGRGSLARFIRDEGLYLRTNARLAQLEGAVRSAGKSGKFAELIRDDVQYREFRAAVTRFDRSLSELEAGRGRAGEFLRSPERHADWTRRVASIRGRIGEIRKNRFLAGDGDYEKWNRAVEKLIRDVDAVNAGEGSLGTLLQTAQTYESLEGASRNLQNFLSEFQRDPRKFLRVDLDLF